MINNILGISISITILVLSCLAINYSSDKLGDCLNDLANKLRVNKSIKGAVFDGISSSIPEFLTSVIASMMVLGIFGTPDPTAFNDVGVGTITGSAIFNILIIPFLSILMTKKEQLESIEINKSFMIRDMVFYIFAIGLLFVGSYLGSFNRIIGSLMTLLYIGYMFKLKSDNKQTKDEVYEEVKEKTSSIILKSILWLVPIGIGVHYAVVSTETIGIIFGIPRLILSLVILASVTSLPDALLSIKSAKNGDLDASISNAIGSNSFDINIALGFVLLITGINVNVVFSEVAFLFVFLIMSSISYTIAFYFKLNKTKKLLLLGIPYAIFVAYLITLI